MQEYVSETKSALDLTLIELIGMHKFVIQSNSLDDVKRS